MSADHAQASRLAHIWPPSKTEWGSLLELLPSSVDLISPGVIARQGVALLSNAANAQRFRTVLTSARHHLREGGVPISVQQPKDACTLVSDDELSRSQRRWLGQVVLELYFTQLFRSEVALADLWPSRLGVDESGDAVWFPRPIYLRWDCRFRKGLQDIYAGFILDDRVRFDHGVFQLGLGGAADTLVAHFGDGKQRSVRFGAEVLRQTLASMTERRRSDDRPLHPNFIPFGLCLTALHDRLESLDMRFDVRAAFLRAYPGNPHR